MKQLQQKFLANKLIVITRPQEDSVVFKKELEKYGARVYPFPTITIMDNTIDPIVQNACKKLPSYDWIIFTSTKGVEFFMEALHKMNIASTTIKSKQIAVVGPQTAKKVQSYGLPVPFIPTLYTTEQIAKELDNVQGKNILLARSHLGSKQLVHELENKGGRVTDIPIYKTDYIKKIDSLFTALVRTDKISYITFTSPSTVTGFIERVKKTEVADKVYAIPVISIGPVTTKAAEKYGFRNIITADTYTTNGMIKKLLSL